MTAVALHLDPCDGDHLLALPPYCRPSADAKGRYWHMPRSAYVRSSTKRDPERLIISFWCGQHRYYEWMGGLAVHQWLTDVEPDGDLCASCFGRAEAYHVPSSGLRFEPRDHFREPSWCPFDRQWPADGGSDCPLCGHRLSHARGWTAYGCARHKPAGLTTTDPCPSHGWSRISCYPDGLRCIGHRCGYSAPWGHRWPIGGEV